MNVIVDFVDYNKPNNMNNINILKAHIDIKTTILRFELSIQDLKEKHPDRTDLINTMTETLNDILEFQNAFIELENSLKLEYRTNFRLEHVNLTLKEKIRELELEGKMQREGI